MKLPGWSYMLVGVVMMAYTKFIESRKPSATIGIFFWIGVAILAYGFLKEVIPRLLTKRKKKPVAGPPHVPRGHHVQQPSSPHASHGHVQGSHAHVQGSHHGSHPYPPTKSCPVCRRIVHAETHYCNYCGHRFLM